MGKKSLRSPILWYGGKGLMKKKLLALFPPHDSYRLYVELFGGGASLLLAKGPSPVEVYNDIDSGLVNLFRVLRDKEKFEKFYEKVQLTPYSREEYYNFLNTWEDIDDEIERAYQWYIVCRMSFRGNFGSSWLTSIKMTRRGISGSVSSWLSIIELLPEIYERFRLVQIEHRDWRDIFRIYDRDFAFFYVDPPYIINSRQDKNPVYLHEMSEDDHKELVQTLLSVKGKVMLSGYNHEIYSELDRAAGWRKEELSIFTRISIVENSAARKRTECVWMNY